MEFYFKFSPGKIGKGKLFIAEIWWGKSKAEGVTSSTTKVVILGILMKNEILPSTGVDRDKGGESDLSRLEPCVPIHLLGPDQPRLTVHKDNNYEKWMLNELMLYTPFREADLDNYENNTAEIYKLLVIVTIFRL